MTKLQAEKLAQQFEFSLTPLRKDVLEILIRAKKPLGAYDILHQIQRVRPKAAPPTVYRVLDFFCDHHLVHRLDASHMYVLCVHSMPHASAILFNCKQCKKSIELVDSALARHLAKLGEKNKIHIQNHLIEISGYCSDCA